MYKFNNKKIIFLIIVFYFLIFLLICNIRIYYKLVSPLHTSLVSPLHTSDGLLPHGGIDDT